MAPGRINLNLSFNSRAQLARTSPCRILPFTRQTLKRRSRSSIYFSLHRFTCLSRICHWTDRSLQSHWSSSLSNPPNVSSRRTCTVDLPQERMSLRDNFHMRALRCSTLGQLRTQNLDETTQKSANGLHQRSNWPQGADRGGGIVFPTHARSLSGISITHKYLLSL